MNWKDYFLKKNKIEIGDFVLQNDTEHVAIVSDFNLINGQKCPVVYTCSNKKEAIYNFHNGNLDGGHTIPISGYTLLEKGPFYFI